MSEKPFEDVVRELRDFVCVIGDTAHITSEMLLELRESISKAEVSEALLILQQVEDKQCSTRELMDRLLSILNAFLP